MNKAYTELLCLYYKDATITKESETYARATWNVTRSALISHEDLKKLYDDALLNETELKQNQQDDIEKLTQAVNDAAANAELESAKILEAISLFK